MPTICFPPLIGIFFSLFFIILQKKENKKYYLFLVKPRLVSCQLKEQLTNPVLIKPCFCQPTGGANPIKANQVKDILNTITPFSKIELRALRLQNLQTGLLYKGLPAVDWVHFFCLPAPLGNNRNPSRRATFHINIFAPRPPR